MPGHEELIIGLDVGTTKICAVVGEITGSAVDIVGIGSHPSIGLRKGVVVNIESTVDSIKKAIEEAELMAGCEIRSVHTGIAGGHIKGFNSHGIIGVKGDEVTENDIARVIEAARAVAIPMDREVIHCLPQSYCVDDEKGITNPLGMEGVRLEAKVHIVTAAVASAHNIIKCCNLSGLDVEDVVLQSLASSEAVLTPEERELGVALIDCGGGTTDLAIFSGRNIRHTSVLALGGNNLTNDLAIGLRTPIAEAEKIKKKYGTCDLKSIAINETLEIPSVGGKKPRSFSRKIICEMLQPRVEEIYSLVYQEIYEARMENRITAGIVITGGSTLLDGAIDAAESVFNLPIRLGVPQGVSGLSDVVNNPMYATAVGLVLYGRRHRSKHKFRIRDKNIFQKVMSTMKKWFRDII